MKYLSSVTRAYVLTLLIAYLCLFVIAVCNPSYALSTPVPTQEQVVEEPKVVEVKEEPEPEPVYTGPVYTDEEIELLALVTMGEAEGESELGKRLVIDTLLNRVESDGFPDTVEGVVYQPGQFECMWNGRIERCSITDEVLQLVREEIENRVFGEILYFRAGYYHDFGTPVVNVGNHYFSTN